MSCLFQFVPNQSISILDNESLLQNIQVDILNNVAINFFQYLHERNIDCKVILRSNDKFLVHVKKFIRSASYLHSFVSKLTSKFNALFYTEYMKYFGTDENIFEYYYYNTESTTSSYFMSNCDDSFYGSRDNLEKENDTINNTKMKRFQEQNYKELVDEYYNLVCQLNNVSPVEHLDLECNNGGSNVVTEELSTTGKIGFCKQYDFDFTKLSNDIQFGTIFKFNNDNEVEGRSFLIFEHLFENATW